MSRFLSVDELIGTLLDETFYYVYVGALRGGAVRQANLDLLLEKAQAFVANGKSGLHGFVTLMDSLRDNVSMGAAQPSAIDAVRVMSIHKSKGLSFRLFSFAEQRRNSAKKATKPMLFLTENLESVSVCAAKVLSLPCCAAQL